MKKSLLASVLMGFAALSLHADIIFYEGFNYADGSLTNVAPNIWYKHSGAAVPSDSIVKNKHVEIASSSPGAVPRQDDVNRRFTTFTNTQTIVFGSFTVNCTNLPPAVGTYITHFFVNGTTFHGRVFAQAGALPNTWRLGVAAAATTVNQVFPIDLAINTDYQVVIKWDPTGFNAATLWVNPITSGDTSVVTGDAVASPAASVGFGLRQAGSFGNAFFYLTNIAVATTFEEAQTNVWSTNALPPVIVYQPQTGTNFPGESFDISGVSVGQGIAGTVYTWLKNGVGVSNPNGNSNVLSLTSVAVSDTGNYQLVATTPFGLSATSAMAFRWITNSPIPPIITVQPPTNNPVFYHQTISISVTAIGPPPLAYQWYYTNAPATGGNVSGADSATITISDVFTNNGTTGNYYLVVSNPNGNTTSRVASVTAIPPSAATIAFLRTLVDPVNYVATNSNLRWQATGIVTTFTNLTSGDTASYYLQDGTAGINIFVTHGSAFRPQQGDVVTFVGWLSSFGSTLELEADASDPTTSFAILSNNIPGLPPQRTIPFSITNNLAFCETNLEGRVVMLTNVYFGANEGAVISTNANNPVTVSNAAGETFTIFFSPQDLDTAGQTLPSFARTVVGVFNQNLGNGVTPRNQGYQVAISRFSDIVTGEIVLAESVSGTTASLSWTSAPLSYAYSVQTASNVAGPFTTVRSNVHFLDFSGSYTDSNAVGSQKYYRVTTP